MLHCTAMWWNHIAVIFCMQTVIWVIHNCWQIAGLTVANKLLCLSDVIYTAFMLFYIYTCSHGVSDSAVLCPLMLLILDASFIRDTAETPL